MEFKYRAVDERRSALAPPHSSYSYFAEQALQGGHGLAGPGFSHPNTYYQNPNEMPEVIWRELEKEKIREEIIAAEIARRRVLEAEVRREMIERELAMHRGADGFYYPPALSMVRFDSRGVLAPHLLPRAEGMHLDGKTAMSLEERLGMSAMLRREFKGFDSTPFQPQRSSEPRISEVTPASEISKEKEKIVILTKPVANLSGMKRKAEIPALLGSTDIPSAGAPKKKVREEWSCAICQVSATSERGLNEHLLGKKHKAREAGLRKNGKNFSIGLYPKNTTKPYKPADIANAKTNGPTDIANNPSSEQGMNTVTVDKLGLTSLQEEMNTESAKKNGAPSLAKNQKPDNSAKTHEAKVQRKQKNKESKKKKFNFWCEMCKVGAFSEKVMEAHRTGKKHIARLQDVNHISGAELSSQAVRADQGLNLAGVPGKDGENSLCKNADGVAV